MSLSRLEQGCATRLVDRAGCAFGTPVAGRRRLLRTRVLLTDSFAVPLRCSVTPLINVTSLCYSFCRDFFSPLRGDLRVLLASVIGWKDLP